jgi:hypothetical protein
MSIIKTIIKYMYVNYNYSRLAPLRSFTLRYTPRWDGKSRKVEKTNFFWKIEFFLENRIFFIYNLEFHYR